MQKTGAVTTDSIPPDLQLNLSGGGFNKTFRSDEDYSIGQLNLKPLTHYTIRIAINDAGGVNRLQLQLDKIINPGIVLGITAVTMTEDIVQNIYSIFGTSTDPYTSSIITGSFDTPNVDQNVDEGFNIKTNGSDYTPNSVHINIIGSISYKPSGGYGWVLF